MEGPALRYYRRLVGAWSGAFSFVVTDPGALAAAGWSTSLPLRALALLANLGVRMSTTLAGSSEGRAFDHTTRVTLFGVPLYVTWERFAIEEDERSFRVTGAQRQLFARAVPYEGHGSVAADADGATYHLSLFEAALTQETRIVGNKVALAQRSPWTQASVLLARSAR